MRARLQGEREATMAKRRVLARVGAGRPRF